jgi:hypothetical protein
LRAAPLDAAALAQGLAERFGADAAELRPEIEDMLTELARLDLVESVAC